MHLLVKAGIQHKKVQGAETPFRNAKNCVLERRKQAQPRLEARLDKFALSL
jgi:hypothetical protein